MTKDTSQILKIDSTKKCGSIELKKNKINKTKLISYLVLSVGTYDNVAL